MRALLRQQLIVLRRTTNTPRLTWRERLSLLFLARWVPNWKQVVQIIQPDTLLRWHREDFRLFSPILAAEIAPARADPASAPGSKNDCIDRAASGRHRGNGILDGVARENRLWGAERIRSELLKLNIKVAKRTIQKYMQAVR